jgi:hypothetical protein
MKPLVPPHHKVSVGRSEHFVGGDKRSCGPLPLGALTSGQVALNVIRKPPRGRLVKAPSTSAPAPVAAWFRRAAWIPTAAHIPVPRSIAPISKRAGG